MHCFCVTSAGSRMQTYQSLSMHRQHHKKQIQTKTTHSHQRGVNTWQERKEAPMAAVRPAQTLCGGSGCPKAAPLAPEQQQQQEGRGRGEQGQRGWVRAQPGQLGHRQGGTGGHWRGPRAAWRISSFPKWDSQPGRQRQEMELLIYLSWHYIKLQSLESKHQVKRNQRSYISHHKGFPLPFWFAFSKLTPRNWALILGSMR